ncbi:MAG: 23S rRNA (uracil(1939)-C(5))-methyltransferase RlmD [Gammaproteobacteria bacterium]|nr:23S rRNA (uracil(1939)-C(5))-methyltransferase RlmD [Gammaproteobacteria bacterium]
MTNRRKRRNRLPSEAVNLTISGLSHEGRGIAHIEGKVAFVDGALEGEEVTANYLRSRSQFAELKINEILSASAERVSPPCEYTGICGGCSLQHWAADKQLDFKQSVLCEYLQHAANLQPGKYTLLPQIKAQTTHYRRKARLAVRKVVKKGGVLVGFREKYSSFITDMHDCQVLVKEVAALILPLREFLTNLNASSEIPQIEVAAGEVDCENNSGLKVARVIRHLVPLSAADLTALREFANAHEIDIYLQAGGLDSVCKLDQSAGPERLHYFLPGFDLQLAFHPTDFTQVNGEINRLIVSRAVAMLELEQTDTVLDLFCGLGNFTLPIARHCGRVVGIEGSDAMVARGNENAKLNNIVNAEFYAADLSAAIDSKCWYQQAYSKVLLDPPRSGAIEIIPQIAKLGARKIIYISCNPATLARDAAELIRQGYKLNSAGVMDMFPHTTHVESMAEFVLPSN